VTNNPPLQPWTAPCSLSPFDAIRPEHFEPAFEAAMRERRGELRTVGEEAEAPSFDNTVAAFGRSRRRLARISSAWAVHIGVSSALCIARKRCQDRPEVARSASMSARRPRHSPASPAPGPFTGRIRSLRLRASPYAELVTVGRAGMMRSTALTRSPERTLAACGDVCLTAGAAQPA